MFKIKYLAPVLASFFLFGCGSSMPECGDKEVINLMKEIAAERNVELVKVSNISTKKRTDNSCQCIALGTMKSPYGGQRDNVRIEYEIDLADNGDEFSVTMSW